MEARKNGKVKEIFCIAAAGLYIVAAVFAIRLDVFFAGNARFIINILFTTLLNLSAAVSVIIYLAVKKSGKKWVNYVMPVGFALKALTAFSLAFSSGSLLAMSGIIPTVFYLLSCLQGISVITTFIGTLAVSLRGYLKWGALTFAAAAVLSECLKLIVYGIPIFSLTSFLSVLTSVIFYLALFIKF